MGSLCHSKNSSTSGADREKQENHGKKVFGWGEFTKMTDLKDKEGKNQGSRPDVDKSRGSREPTLVREKKKGK